MSAATDLRAAAADRILIKDGAFGTLIQCARLAEADYRGDFDLAKDQKGNNDLLCLTRPELIEGIVDSFAEAGADILATNSFNANRISQADYGAEELVSDMNLAAARIVRQVADRRTAADGKPRWVAGALGPTNKTLSLSPRRRRSRLSRGRFRHDEGGLSRAGRGAGRGRGRFHPDRDDLRHVERQGRDHGGAGSRSGARPPAAADDVDDADRS